MDQRSEEAAAVVLMAALEAALLTALLTAAEDTGQGGEGQV